MGSAMNALTTFVHFLDGARVETLPVSAHVWEELAAGNHASLDEGRLMTAFSFAEPWSQWERHPAGEELVLLLSGAASVVFEESGAERVVHLSEPGAFVLVPPNVWHTARTAVPTTMLFLTPGAGTQHRPVGV